ncbi:MAG: TonB-dependent receptor [Betaproteobacteria bacterium]
MRGPAVSPLLLVASLLSSAVAAGPAPEAARAARAGLTGVVRDATGAPIAGATLSLATAQGASLTSARSDARGSFVLEAVPGGSYLLRVAATGFVPRRLAVRLDASAPGPLEVPLLPESFRDEVTVTATPGSVETLDRTAQRVNVVDEERIALRAKSVLAQAVADEEGLQLQRTSPTVAGVFVRGLTGAKVNVYLDGVRYTTSAQRGGISTFFDLVEPSALEAIEVVRGPSSAEFGSDALGGSVQLLTRAPALGPGGRFSGAWAASGGSADASFGSALDAAWAGPRLGLSATLAARRVNRLRPGGGVDSRNAVTRFLGLSSDAVIDGRLPDTAFTQYGGRLRASWALGPATHLSAGYLRGQQDGGRRYDQLLGGDGNLIADLRNLMSDLGFLRLEKLRAGWLDRASVTYSFTAQREERVNQGGSGNPRASVNHEPERTTVHGAQARLQRRLGRHELSLGGDWYLERLAAASFAYSPVSGAIAARRGRVPDGARYRHGGAFLQDAFEAVPGRLRLTGAMRWSAAAYEARAADSPLVNGQPLWPDDSYDTRSLTFRAGAVWFLANRLALSGNLSRGFRAPDVTDLGTFGLTGSGYEVSAREVAGLEATVGSTADATAVGTGEPVRVLDAETSLSCELGLRWRTSRLRADLTVFQTDVDRNVAKQALILPAGAVGKSLAAEPVVRQLESGVVYVAASPSPVLARVNYGAARLRGLEASVEAQLLPVLSLGAVLSAVRAEDGRSGRPPNIEGGTPAPEAWLRLRLAPCAGKRFWVEPYLHAAARQARLSSLDLEDRRTGATRSRSSIASFFANGARARGLVGAGADGIAGDADDVLLATGETLAQVQERVLGPGLAAAPLFPALPGYVVFGLRGALRFAGRHELLFELENLGDRSYRGVSWGLDAPGRGVFLRYELRF